MNYKLRFLLKNVQMCNGCRIEMADRGTRATVNSRNKS
jgi:hypothetical protein